MFYNVNNFNPTGPVYCSHQRGGPGVNVVWSSSRRFHEIRQYSVRLVKLGRGSDQLRGIYSYHADARLDPSAACSRVRVKDGVSLVRPLEDGSVVACVADAACHLHRVSGFDVQRGVGSATRHGICSSGKSTANCII